MTNEQFRECFVGEKGYDALKKLMRNGNELLTDLAKCWQERYDLEMVYAKSLRKNSETLMKLAGRAKGSLVQGLTVVATQTNIESEAHQAMANVLLNKISVPMKNLAETQMKSRKPIEDVLNTKFKSWKDQRDIDYKYRQRQFEKCKEIEGMYLRMDEIPKTTKNSVKETSKPIATLNGKQTLNIETALQKLEQELEKTEKKYHDATKEVEVYRQYCDVEMCRACDQMQSMEMDRMVEIDTFIRTYANAVQTMTQKMKEVRLKDDVTDDLNTIRITPQEDLIGIAKSNLLVPETEILLYDIYAENEQNVMSHERRVLSLMRWIEMLKQDIEIQRRSKDGPLVVDHHQRDQNDSDGDEDEDGAMRHHHPHPHHQKTERKTEGIETLQGFCKQNQKFSTGLNNNEIFANRQAVRLLQSLYEASLYKFEKVYNHLKNLPEPNYEYGQRFAKSSTDKGTPTTFLRIPYQPLIPVTAPVPSPMACLARTTPLVAPQSVPNAPPPPYSTQAPTHIGWAVNDLPADRFLNYHRPAAPAPASTLPYPVLPSESNRQYSPQIQRVRVLHAYEARHDDELTIRPGDIITLLERRSDQWCKGSLHGSVGLFPGNFAEDFR